LAAHNGKIKKDNVTSSPPITTEQQHNRNVQLVAKHNRSKMASTGQSGKKTT
jgi:hypothetical protein